MSVYMPSEALDGPLRRRFLDWRFLAALAALLMVGFLVWAGFRNYEIREAEAAQKDALLTQLAARSNQIESLEGQVAGLNRRIAGLQDAARADRRLATKERSRLLKQQARMLELLRAANVEYVPAEPVSYGPEPVAAPPSYTAPVAPAAASGGGGDRVAGTSTTRKRVSAPTAGRSGKVPGGKAKGLR